MRPKYFLIAILMASSAFGQIKEHYDVYRFQYDAYRFQSVLDFLRVQWEEPAVHGVVQVVFRPKKDGDRPRLEFTEPKILKTQKPYWPTGGEPGQYVHCSYDFKSPISCEWMSLPPNIKAPNQPK